MMDITLTKLDINNNNSVKNFNKSNKQFSIVIDQPFNDIKTLIKTCPKINNYTTNPNGIIEAQFCFNFGRVIAQCTPYTDNKTSVVSQNKSPKTKVVIQNNHIHSNIPNRKSFDKTIDYIQSNT